MISMKIKKNIKKIFRVGPLFVGSVGLPETHIFFQSALLDFWTFHQGLHWIVNSPLVS